MTALAEPGLTDRLFHEAHTAYRFTDESVDDALLTTLYHLVRQAPTAINSQPLRIVFVRTDEAKQRLLPLLAEGNRAKSASAPVVALLAYDLDFHHHLPHLAPHAPQLRDRFDDPARREETARFNATLQAGYTIIAARALGLDAGPMGGFDADGVDAEFLRGTSWRSFMVLNLGHVAPDGHRPRAPRLDTADAVRLI